MLKLTKSVFSALLTLSVIILAPNGMSCTQNLDNQNPRNLQNEPELLAYYKNFNKRYFGNKLPNKNVYLEWGLTTKTCVTRYEGEPETTDISIGEYLRLHQKSVCMHVLHEMAHFAVRIKYPNRRWSEGNDTDKDDVAFQKEMLRLANIGAFREYW